MNKQHTLYRKDISNIISIQGIERLAGKTILITGATGMVGTMLIDALMYLDFVKVIAVGRDIHKAKERLGEYFGCDRFSFICQDVCEPFDKELRADYIIPAASNTHPLAYSQFPIETMMINLKGAEHALILANRIGAEVIYPSTNEVYGNALGDEDFTEDYNGLLSLNNARACYNESKRSCEAMCHSFMAEHGVKIKIARLCRIFGPTMLMSDSKASSQFIKKALVGEDIVLKSKGTQYFSYTYVAEAVRGLMYVLLNGEYGVPYNISSEKTNVTLRDFAGLCAKVNGKDVIFDLPDSTESRGYSVAQRAILVNDRIKSIGFTPIYELEDAIRRTIEILKQK